MNTIRLLLILLSTSLFVFLVACNTVHGAGKDLQAGGSAIAKAASKGAKDD